MAFSVYGVSNVHVGLFHLHLQRMKMKPGLHLLFTREVLAEIPNYTGNYKPMGDIILYKRGMRARNGRCRRYGNVRRRARK